MLAEIIVYLHIMSLALWFGALFGYLVIVWPAAMDVADGAFPRNLLVRIGMLTAPWIYLAMFTALATLGSYWFLGYGSGTPILLYLAVLSALVANNVYGSLSAWPRIMISPDGAARKAWFWFRVRMGLSLVAGLSLLSIGVIAA